jgi:hypothetical protein
MALGRLCQRTEGTAHGQPDAEALDALVEMALLALTMGRPSGLCPGECAFRQALTLTRSTVHAASASNYHDTWSDWLRILIGSVGQVIDTATSPLLDGSEFDRHPSAAEHHRTAAEILDLEARALLTTCIEALALFGEADRSLLR